MARVCYMLYRLSFSDRGLATQQGQTRKKTQIIEYAKFDLIISRTYRVFKILY